ncbi:hypothetical protein L2249_04240 [Xanthomonas perforans]|uniref:Uncharacterized protein n=3 Tax=Xanthomonas TaxID=338 RepID=A0A6P0G4C9_XANPE|nr:MULTISPECIES: hypothetical protein [Xanthomonas]EGD08927.1 hypothetical protein XVE_2804 [Xanthomonas vesicatoria ATCC 35937]MCC8516579.1 hypothetical protein [Xanthomonas euvesicatoria pv. euvesicatoria]MCC8599281.1 hypothetical protein [Xanthomonas vesicatoria]MCC8605857.1 hypothetical protein [Xanthomonas vesicatoria]MCC8607815.1 hypothetical protein [Xanthomonas vesicatoria]
MSSRLTPTPKATARPEPSGFPHRSGGYTLKLRTVPVAIDGEVTLIVRKREPRDKGEGENWNLPD